MDKTALVGLGLTESKPQERTPPSHGGGREFESPSLHHGSLSIVLAVEVSPEGLELGAIPQRAINDHEDAVGDRNDGLIVVGLPPALEPPVLRSEQLFLVLTAARAASISV